MKHPFQWSFSLDRYVNPWVPRPPLARLPVHVSRFLGYRPPAPAHVAGRPPHGNLVSIFWAFLGVFCGISVVEVVTRSVPSFQARDVPLIIGSFGAAAVLEFYTIESPLAQPRNAVLGQVLACVVGIAISKLFALGPVADGDMWASGALACACATALMALTGTVHPPAGATALLAVVDPRLSALGWFLLPVVVLSCVLMQAVALAVNNLQRRFPVYWWTPEEVGSGWDRLLGRRKERERKEEEEERKEKDEVKIHVPLPGEGDAEAATGRKEVDEDVPVIVICRGTVTLKHGPELQPEELAFLEGLSKRL